MKPTTSTATGLLSALSVLLGLFGLAGASQATFGVAIVGLALLCGVLARIAQAGHQHRELLDLRQATERVIQRMETARYIAKR